MKSEGRCCERSRQISQMSLTRRRQQHGGWIGVGVPLGYDARRQTKW